MEYGSKIFYDFADGVRSMRRLSDSIDDVMAAARYHHLDTAEQAADKLRTLAEEATYSAPSFTGDVSGGLYRTGGNLAFGWCRLSHWAQNPVNRDGAPRFDATWDFRVFAHGGKFRDGSRLRAALYGAGWQITEHPPEPTYMTPAQIEPYLVPGFAAQLEEEIPAVPPHLDFSTPEVVVDLSAEGGPR